MKKSKTVLCVLLCLFALYANSKQVWLKTSIQKEKVNCSYVYEGVLLIGTERGIYSGKAVHLDGGIGYPDHEWEIEPIRSSYISAEHEPRLKNTTSIAVLKSTVYAISDSGLYSIKPTLWGVGIIEQEWVKDETFTSVEKLSGNGEAVYLLSDGKLYKKVVGAEWKEVPFYNNTDGPALEITDFKVTGNDIVVVINSQYDSPGEWSDIYVSADSGASWIESAVHIPNLADYSTYRTFWNDEFPDLVYCNNETYNDSTKITFKEDLGAITIDGTIKAQEVVEVWLQGFSTGVAVSYTSKSDIPQFYLSTLNGLYFAGDDYSFQMQEDAPTQLQGVWVGRNESADLLAFSDSTLYYRTYWHGDPEAVLSPVSVNRDGFLTLTQNKITFSYPNAEGYSLYNLLGKEVSAGTTNQSITTIDATALAKGSYILQVALKNRVIVRKLALE